MMTYPQKERYDINDLIEVIRMLRLPDGCPWDKVQTHESIRMNFIEEVYEVIEAIDKNDTALMREELGDVLMQVVFHAQMEREQGNFDFDDVCDEVCRKLIIRHPHVAVSLPALMRAQKVGKRAAKSGFDFANTADTFAKLQSEVTELQEAIQAKDSDAAAEELGDLLFSCTNLARALDVDAEETLTAATEKFIRRFAKVEQAATAAGKKTKHSGSRRKEQRPMRLDKYLKVSRLIKRRTVANEACDAEKVLVNGKVARASYDVKVGDVIEINMGQKALKVKVEQVLEHVLKDDAAGMYTVVE